MAFHNIRNLLKDCLITLARVDGPDWRTIPQKKDVNGDICRNLYAPWINFVNGCTRSMELLAVSIPVHRLCFNPYNSKLDHERAREAESTQKGPVDTKHPNRQIRTRSSVVTAF